MQINVNHNMFHFDLEDLVLIGKRANNSKRNFLFISKLLGKHLAVHPDVCKAAGYLLSSLAYGNSNQQKYVDFIKCQNFDIKPYFVPIEVEEKPLFIGFAETATGLGMSAASAIKNSTFYTTTRETADMVNLLTFEEEHSHATTHKMYTSEPIDFSQFDEIVLVDDEITTGNSMLNLIRELYHKYGVKKYKILTILDWRGAEHFDNFNAIRKQYGLDISVYSLLGGDLYTCDGNVYTGDKETEILNFANIRQWELPKFPRMFCNSNDKIVGFLKDTGRFGLQHERFEFIEKNAQAIAEKINLRLGDNKKILVVGHGENIYIPSRIAAYLKGDVQFKTTTRSPIYVDEYIIKSRHFFIDNGVKYYFYNIEEAENNYDYVVFVNEFDLTVRLTSNTKIIKL